MVGESKPTKKKIEKAKELKKKMEQNPETILIDCREQGEWDEHHVDGFTLIPLSCFEQSLKVLQLTISTINPTQSVLADL